MRVVHLVIDAARSKLYSRTYLPPNAAAAWAILFRPTKRRMLATYACDVRDDDRRLRRYPALVVVVPADSFRIPYLLRPNRR